MSVPSNTNSSKRTCCSCGSTTDLSDHEYWFARGSTPITPYWQKRFKKATKRGFFDFSGPTGYYGVSHVTGSCCKACKEAKRRRALPVLCLGLIALLVGFGMAFVLVFAILVAFDVGDLTQKPENVEILMPWGWEPADTINLPAALTLIAAILAAAPFFATGTIGWGYFRRACVSLTTPGAVVVRDASAEYRKRGIMDVTACCEGAGRLPQDRNLDDLPVCELPWLKRVNKAS